MDATYDLTTEYSSIQNWGGENEKWFRSRDYNWYFILPTGDVYRWGGTQHAIIENGEHLATLDSSFYETPANLIDAVDPHLQIDLNQFADGQEPNSVALSREGDYISVRINGEVAYQRHVAAVTSIEIVGTDASDQLMVQNTLGLPIHFAGGTGADHLTIRGGDGEDAAVINGDSVDLNGETITFAGIENVNVDLGNGPSTTQIDSFGDVANLTVSGGAQDDAFIINTTDDSTGNVTFDGRGGIDTLTAANRTDQRRRVGDDGTLVAQWNVHCATGGSESLDVHASEKLFLSLRLQAAMTRQDPLAADSGKSGYVP